MKLEIKAIQYKGQPIRTPLTAVFDEEGGTIGRSPANNLVLVDEEKVVSSKHAVIHFENGFYYYIDESTNGSWFTHRDQWIHHEKIMLQDEDEVSIGDYDIIITVSKKTPEIEKCPFGKSFFSVFDRKQLDQKRSSSEELFSNVNNNFEDEKLNYDRQTELAASVEDDFSIQIDQLSPSVPVDAEKNTPGLPQNLSLEDFFADEKKEKVGFVKDNGSDLKASEKKDQSSRANGGTESSNHVDSLMIDEAQFLDDIPPVQGPMAWRGDAENDEKQGAFPDDDILNPFFDALGVTDSNTLSKEEIADLMRTTGLVVRELVDGLMSILRGRTQLKSQLRVSVTTIKKIENNPLKFSPSCHEALKALLISKPSGFLSAVDAIREGFEDIKDHQMAITAGMQASLVEILKRFDPDRFEQKYTEGIVLQKKTKCWNEYRQSYHKIVEEAVDGFLGESFVRAYEAQNEKLKFERRKKR